MTDKTLAVNLAKTDLVDTHEDHQQTAEKSQLHVDLSWRQHCRNAVSKFVMNAVVIDNQPILNNSYQPAPIAKASIAKVLDDGMEGLVDEPAENKDMGEKVQRAEDVRKREMEEAQGAATETRRDEEGEAESPQRVLLHDLDVRQISDAFARHQIACAFVFPHDSDPEEENILNRVMAATDCADIVVIDWYLRDQAPTLTMKILRKIAERDVAENGRMRLICVYTGQPDMNQVVRDAANALNDGGLKSVTLKEDEGYARGKEHCLLVLNKQHVIGDQLPEQLLDALTDLADGLLPTFALAAVAAVRRNVHHIITRFSAELDAAYVANRLITNPPGEVAELMRDLFVSECDTALGLERVADQFLETDQIKSWLENRRHPKNVLSYKVKSQDISIDGGFLNALIEDGISNGMITINKNQTKFPEDKRNLISHCLHGDEKSAKVAESSFARHITLKREAFGQSKLRSEEGWTPSLTLGTILRQNAGTKEEPKHLYFYCLTPACDTVRLNGDERTFLVLELEEAKEKTNLLIAEEGGTYKCLYIDPKPMNIRAYRFKSCQTSGRVKAKARAVEGQKTESFFFETCQEPVFEALWLGEVRRNRANRDMANLNREWLRFGIKDSEYLRLSEKGKILDL